MEREQGRQELKKLADKTKDPALRQLQDRYVPGPNGTGEVVGRGGNPGDETPSKAADDGGFDDIPVDLDKDAEDRYQKAGDLQLDSLKTRLKEILRDPSIDDEQQKKFQADLDDLNSLISERERARANGELPPDITPPNGFIGDRRGGDSANGPGSKSNARQGRRGRLPNRPPFDGKDADNYLNELAKKVREQQEKEKSDKK